MSKKTKKTKKARKPLRAYDHIYKQPDTKKKWVKWDKSGEISQNNVAGLFKDTPGEQSSLDAYGPSVGFGDKPVRAIGASKFRTSRPSSDGIVLQKKHGQYFLRNKSVLLDMLLPIDLKDRSVFEIGCGDGFLTREILTQKIKQLWVFEIDNSWAQKVATECADDRLRMIVGDFLEANLEQLKLDAPWVLLANLPYHLTFPILHRLHEHRAAISEGVIMIQEEVAQKIIQTRGRGYGYVSLFFQYYFDWKLLTKIAPSSFYPEPKVFSRLLYFKTKQDVVLIPEEAGYWKFIRFCFAHPRRTLRNNLAQTHISLELFPQELLALRAQQLSMAQFLELWEVVRKLTHK